MSFDRALQLKNLNFYGMAAAWGEWQAEVGSQQMPVTPEVWLDRLISAEQADRHSLCQKQICLQKSKLPQRPESMSHEKFLIPYSTHTN